MKRIIQIIPFLFIFPLFGQSSFIKWISTPEDELVTNLNYLNNNGVYFYSTKTTSPGDTYFDFDSYFNYSNSYFIADLALNNQDSITLDTKDNYLLEPLRFLTEFPNEIVLFGSALDTITFDEQLYIVWLDKELNIIKDSLYGLPERNDRMAGFFINHDQHIIFSRRFFINKKLSEPEMRFVLWEIDLQGNEIQYSADTIPYFPLHEGFDMSDKNRYQFQTIYDVALFDYELNYDTSYSWYEMMFHFETAKQIDETKYFLIGDYNSNMPPFTYEDFDLAFMIMDDEQSYYNLQKFGAADTNEMLTKLDFITPDTIFIGGRKQVVPSTYDTWVTVYKTNLNGDIFFFKNFGGYGRYGLNYLLATQDGGCIAGCSFWDFYENPSYHTRDIVFLKYNSNGDLITTIPENSPPIIISDFLVYPNPGNDALNLNSGKDGLIIQLFNLDGKMVIEKAFDKSVSINTGQFPKGVYSYRIFQNGKQLENGKWVKN